MNLSRAFAEKVLSSQSTSVKHFLQPLAILQSSLYSTSSSTRKPRISKKPVESVVSSASIPESKDQNVVEIPSKLNLPEEKIIISSSFKKDLPRPTEIPWQAKIVNSVDIIGSVSMPVQFEESPDGKYWAGTVLTRKNLMDSTTLWIPIIFEGDLAHVALCHLKEKDLVHVAGQLSGDPPQVSMQHGQPSIQVMVHSINFVQESHQGKERYTPSKKHEEAEKERYTAYKKDEEAEKERYTPYKKDEEAEKERYTPYKKDEGAVNVSESLGTPYKKDEEAEKERYTPYKKDEGAVNVSESLGTPYKKDEEAEKERYSPYKKDEEAEKERYTPYKKDEGAVNVSANTVRSKESVDTFWRDLINNPDKWSDYRKKKLNKMVNPKYPDFKHSDSGQALWLSSAPKWALPGVQRLDNKGDNDGEYWKDLVENPSRWWDNRPNKFNERAPDFKHKDTGKVLWLSDSPAWVGAKLPPLKPKVDSFCKTDTLLS